MIPKRNVAELASEVEDGLEALIAVGRAKLDDLERQKDSLDQEIAAQRRQLRTWETAHTSLRSTDNQRHLRVVGEREPSKREAVLAFLSEAPMLELKLVEIRRALIGRGWMSEDAASIHALEVAVAEMARRGEVTRVRKGHYRLCMDDDDGASTASPARRSSSA